jgi:SAM-dependent methyltransferase
MRIQLPRSEPDHRPEEFQLYDFIREFNNCGYFSDADFDDRYFPKFRWFREALPQEIDKVINLGCGRGRETFALMWYLKATKAVGIDNDHEKIKKANGVTQAIRIFSTEVMPYVLERCPEERARELQAWYENENDVPFGISAGRLPKFCKENAENMSQPYDYFDLVYCRYVLWKILMDRGKEGLFNAIQNMANVVRPKVGRVVIVEPTEKDGVSYDDLKQHFVRADLTLVEVKDENHLGGSEWPGTKPKGYICLKPRGSRASRALPHKEV